MPDRAPLAPALPHRHLTTVTLDVDFAGIIPVGETAAGRRGIAPVTGGRCEGERLSATVLPGADWFVVRPDGALSIDARLTLETDDGAFIYLAYRGAMIADAPAMADFRAGRQLSPDAYRLTATMRFESGDARYRWLNDVLAVAIGEQRPSGPRYTVFEIGSD